MDHDKPNNLPAGVTRNLYCVRDCKVGEYNQPCTFPSDAAAIRAFGDMITRDKESLLAVHPEDFSLVKVGEQDVLTGVLYPIQPTILANGVDFKA